MLSHRAPPNNLTFPLVIKAASAVSSLPLASFLGLTLHGQSIKRGVSDDPFVLTSFVSMYGEIHDIVSARKVFDEIPQPCVVSYNAMIDAFAKNGDMGSAVSLFWRMSSRDVFSWTSIISGYGKNKCFREAIDFFRKMVSHEDMIYGNSVPNEATFVSILSSCSNVQNARALHVGKEIHGYMTKNEQELTVFMRTALIAFYGKMGCFEYVNAIFNMTLVKEVCTWNAMISSLGLNGKEKDALDMFTLMIEKGFKPNEVSFVGVLSACARAKFVDLGMELFNSMKLKFGIVPRMEHYGCVVDLLGRAGLLREAQEFIETMPFEADGSVVGALLGACRLHGATELGDEVGRHLLNLQPHHCGRYVILSSIYAGAERWQNASSLRKDMIDLGIQKIPAYSMIHSS